MNKRSLLLMLLFCLAIPASAYAGQINVNESSNGQIWYLQEGQTLELSLASNPSTGYSWQYKLKPDANILVESGHAYTTQEVIEEPLLVGAGGIECWTFQALNIGKTTFTLWYCRPWESVMPLQIYTMEINVIPKLQINLNQNPLDFDTPPMIIDGNTLVPLRVVFEALGAKVDWKSTEHQVVALKDNKILELVTGSSICYINGYAYTLEIQPPLIGNRVLVPLPLINKFFGREVVQEGDIISIH